MSTERPILELGNPGLRQIARPVETVENAALQALADELLAIMRAANGVGIAAPQLGESWRLLVVASRPNLRYPQAPKMPPTVMINPRLVSHSDDMVKGWEGCLSVPGLRGKVPRYREIEVEYCDRKGHLQRQVWRDFVARIFQHEYDHLEGKIFLDRVESTADLITEKEYFVQLGLI